MGARPVRQKENEQKFFASFFQKRRFFLLFLSKNARDALASVVAAMEAENAALPEGFDASSGQGRGEVSYNPADFQQPRLVIVPVEVGYRWTA